jgi:uncharacterized protein (TIGR03663 family)
MAARADHDQYQPFDSGERTDALRGTLSRFLTLRWETILIIVILLAAIFTRFYMLDARAMSHDESLHVYYSYKLYTEGDFDHTPLMHGPILFHMTAAAFALFGDNDFSGRLYTAVLGVILVMMPLLFRRWLGRWGALLACIMLLGSPLLMYYNRYIRHDTPSILSTLFMVWAIMMYLDGPLNVRKKAYWLYILGAGMIWNLGSKETAFMYIGFIGLFLMLYWFVRMAQQAWKIPGKPLFHGGIMALLLAGFASMGMYIVLDIAPLDSIAAQTASLSWFATLSQDTGVLGRLLWMAGIVLLVALLVIVTSAMVGGLFVLSRGIQRALKMPYIAAVPFFAGTVALAVLLLTSLDALIGLLPTGDARSLFLWSLLVGIVAFTVMFGTLYWALRGANTRIPWRSVTLLIVGVIVVLSGFIIFEEFSHISRDAIGMSDPAVPGENGEVSNGARFTATPLIAVWVLSIVLLGGLAYSQRAGWWRWLHRFPELDILMTMGSLILPWVTAIFIVSARGTSEDYTTIALSVPEAVRGLLPVLGTVQMGQVIVGFIAWLPLMLVAIVAGLTWNWKRYIVTTLIFHAIFAFFFTTVFTNINGLASGMVYSLQYWLEQQAERRGDQPQYYYLLIIMPLYEFLPVIGGGLAMLAGTTMFWKRRIEYRELKAAYDSPAALNADIDNIDFPAAPAHTEYVTLAQDGELTADESAPASDTYTDDPRKDKPKTKRLDTLEPDESWTPFDHARYLTRVPFMLFVGWWAVFAIILFTLAGEKMPWLGTHLTTPLILMTAWVFGRLLERISPALFRYRGWVYLLLVPLMVVALFQVIAPPLGGQPPFSGVAQLQLTWTYNWFAALVLLIGIIAAIYFMTRYTGVAHFWQMFGVGIFAVLTVLTFRAAWMASFINYDYATEFLVYAHGTPGTKIVDEQMREWSQRTVDGMGIRYAYDDRMNWPGVWYFREFPGGIYMGSTPTLQQMEQADIVLIGEANRSVVEPLLEDRYQRFDYKRMWWPMMDYFNLTPGRVTNAFDLAASNTQASGIRRGLFDIWWSRDYTRYGQAVGKDYSTTNWPVGENMSMYVRRDFAQKVWNYGTGVGVVDAGTSAQEISLCVANWQELSASVVFDTSTQLLLNPVGVAVSGDRVYVAEVGANRVSVFSRNGQFIESFGQRGTTDQIGAFFERPYSVDIAEDGTIYVVDTWNYRIRSFSPEGEALATWGSPVTVGINAPEQPVDGFWGPRDVVLDSAGNVYVADTGNKRIRVYSADGQWLRDIGQGGSAAGQIDEPAGLAIHPDGRLFIADTWNRRVSVFNTDGAYVTNFPVRAWYDDLGNRPYIAVDAARDYLYVTDPDAGRVLVYNTAGECVGAFGRPNRDNPNSAQFNTIGGITVDSEGQVYVTDLASGRVLMFPPFPAPAPAEDPNLLDLNEDVIEGAADPDTGDLQPETTEESAPNG